MERFGMIDRGEPSNNHSVSTTSDILARCEQMGFALAGVASVEATAHRDALRQWLHAGRHGEMAYLDRNHQIREEPARLLDGARCAIMVADQYAERAGDDSPSIGVSECAKGDERAKLATPRGKIARYARGDDYHVVMKKRLHALCDELRRQYSSEVFRAFVDTAPVPERELAMRAGLGWIGKHTLLIHPNRGSWMLLGGIMTTLDLDVADHRITDHCGSCTRCIDACPTGCISEYSVDASRCISYLTIEHRSEIAPEFHERIGDWIFGCDVCQEVCPHNSVRSDGAPVGRANGAYAPKRDSFDLLEVLGWSEEDRRAAFTRSSMKRANLGMMKRNAGVVLGNQGGSMERTEPRA